MIAYFVDGPLDQAKMDLVGPRMERLLFDANGAVVRNSHRGQSLGVYNLQSQWSNGYLFYRWSGKSSNY